MNLGQHAGYIVAAYAVAAAVIGALIVWVVFDHLRLRRTLTDLDARGVTRRSEQASEGAR
jgi:heme exporter protein D